MPAKRAHKKSRTGCRVCRTRRVKCDEVRPTCGPCKKHAVACNYDRVAVVTLANDLRSAVSTPTGDRSSVMSLSPSSFASIQSFASAGLPLTPPTTSPPFFGLPHTRMVDLQAMNHYTYMHAGPANDHHPKLKAMWAYTVPQMALGSQMLMDAVLAQGAQHLHVHRPGDEKIRLLSHQLMGKAIRNLHQGLARIDPSSAGLAFATSVMLAFQTFLGWKDPCTVSHAYQLPIEYLMMSHGTMSVWNSNQAAIWNSFMRPLLEEIPSDPNTVSSPFWSGTEEPFHDLALAIQVDESDEAIREVLLSTLEHIRGIYLGVQEGNTETVTRRQLLAFPSRISARFIEFCRQKDPRACVILAYYFTVMKSVEDIWWIQGRPAFDVNGILTLLPQEWSKYMDWPLEAINAAPKHTPKIMIPQPRGLASPAPSELAAGDDVFIEFDFNTSSLDFGRIAT